MLRWIVTLTTLAGLLWGAWIEGGRLYAWKLRRSADRVYYAGELDRSLALYERVRKILPGLPRSHTDLGNALAHVLEGTVGRQMPVQEFEALSARAARHYLEAIRVAPPNAWSYAALGSLATNLRAARIRETGIDLSSLSGDPLEDLFPEDRFSEAVLVKAVQIEPRNYYYRDFLGEFYLRHGFEDRALPHIRMAIRLHPVLGRHYYLSERVDVSPEVLAAVEQGIEDALAADDTVVTRYDIHRFLAAVYLRLGRLDEARTCLEAAAEVAPLPHAVDVQIGQLLAKEGNDEGALEAFRRSTEREPGYHRAWLNLGLTLSRMGRHEEAVEAALRARGLKPVDFTSSWALARVLEAADHTDEAKEVLESLIRTHGDRQQPYLYLIRLYEKHGQLSQALRVARDLAARYPEEPVFAQQVHQLEESTSLRP